MVPAAQAVAAAVRPDRVVIKCVEGGQVGEQVAGEPGEGLRLAQHAHRQFEVVAAPASFHGATGRGQTLAEQARPAGLFKDLPPKRRQERFKAPVANEGRDPVWEAGEQRFIVDGPFLKGDVALPGVERNDRPAEEAWRLTVGGGQVQHRRFGGVVVHDEVERRGAVAAGKLAKGEILDPDSRVE